MTHRTPIRRINVPRLRSSFIVTVLVVVSTLVTAGMVLAGAAVAAPPVEEQKATKAVTLWTCSMHPQIIEDHPGTCPICGMALVPLKTQAAGSGAETPPPAPTVGPAASAAPVAGKARERGKILFYRNPMNPSITSPVPMKDEMGMDYVPVYEGEAAAATHQGAVVTIDPTVVQNMNVVTEKVRRSDVTRQIRTVGTLEYDPERVVSVTTKYDGFVEKVFANYLGQSVRRGDPLFQIYAPELVQTEQELISAVQYARQLDGTSPDAARRARALVDAARTRLSYWDITPAQIDEIERTGRVLRTLPVSAPASGVVIDRMEGLEGMAVRPGMNVLKIADLSDLWLEAEVFDNQLPWVRQGSTARVTVPYFPGETFSGRVRFVEPRISDSTRSVKLTFQIPNRGGRLRANMYATVVFEPVSAHNVLVVPSSAVLRTGERNVVIAALGGGRFAPRDVTLGPEGDGLVQILAGVSEGESVVTSAQFLIDSESNLQAAIQHMIRATTHASGGGDAR